MSETNWQVFASWSLGELSDEEYIEHLLRCGESEDNLLIQILRARAARDEEEQ